MTRTNFLSGCDDIPKDSNNLNICIYKFVSHFRIPLHSIIYSLYVDVRVYFNFFIFRSSKL